MCPLHLTGGCRHCVTVCMWRGRTRWPGYRDVPEIPPNSCSLQFCHLQQCWLAPRHLPWSSDHCSQSTQHCQHTSCSVPSAWGSAFMLSCWFCWVLPHTLSLTPELSSQLDMLVLLSLHSSSLHTEFVMHKKRQTSVKLIFTCDFSRDLCLPAYNQEQAF